jgi:hypothetical protein
LEDAGGSGRVAAENAYVEIYEVGVYAKGLNRFGRLALGR